MGLVEDFRECRRIGTPIILVNAPDYRQSIKDMATVKSDNKEPPRVVWDLVNGHSPANNEGKAAAESLGEPEDTISNPAMCLQRAVGWKDQNKKTKKLPKGTILFMIFSDNDVLNNPATAQAIANCRDEFKVDQRTLVIIGRDLKLPGLVAEDVPVWNVPLPTEDEIKHVIRQVYSYAKVKVNEDDIAKAATYLRGMTAFAVEDTTARKIRRTGLDIEGLAHAQKVVIESTTNRALTFERQKVTFDDVGGLAAIKDFMTKLFAGPKAPKVVVRIDEIEKSIGANASGPVADNTGVSQNILKALLTAMEDNSWTGALLLGSPGSGKTYCTSAVANTFGCLSLIGDLSAVKASLVGESEARVRRMLDVIFSLGGENVMILGTCNKLGVMPPELLRRFNLGIWHFSVPNKAERMEMWKVQTKKYKIDTSNQELPDDEGWVGSDIRNCAQRAWMLGCTLKEAAQFITISGKVSAKDIDQLELLAESSGFLCANYKGVFKRDRGKEEEKPKGRVIKI